MNIIYASPTYGPVDPAAAKSVRVAIMHAARHAGAVWGGDASPDREAWAVARNQIARVASEPANEIDAVFWCDSDMILPQDAITRLMLSGKEFITGIYFQRADPYWPLIAHYDPKRVNKERGKKGVFNWWVKWPENAIAPIDGCGFGCCLTKTELLRAMDPPWFEYKEFSEDFTFCLNAKKAGYQLYVDTNILCGHLADPEPITFETYKTAHPEFYDGQKGVIEDGTIRSIRENRNLGV